MRLPLRTDFPDVAQLQFQEPVPHADDQIHPGYTQAAVPRMDRCLRLIEQGVH